MKIKRDRKNPGILQIFSSNESERTITGMEHSQSSPEGVSTSIIVQKAFKSTKWVFISSIISNAFQFISTIILARLLVPSDFGLMAYATIFTSVIGLFQDLGLRQALIQRKGNILDAANVVFISSMLLGILWYIGSFFAAPYIAGFFKDQKVVPILRMIALSFLITPFGFVQNTILIKDLHFKKVCFINLTSSIIPGILTILLAFWGLGVWSIVYGVLAGTVSNVVISWWIVPWKPKLQFNRSLAGKLFKFGKVTSTESLLSWAVNTVDDVLVGKWLGSSSLGLYRMGFNIGVAPAMHISSPLIGIAFPAFSKMQENRGEIKRALLKCIKLTSLITFPLGAGISATAHLFVPVFFGDKWILSVPVIQYVAIYGMFMSVGSFIPQVYKAIGRPDIYLKYVAVRSAVALPVYYYVVPYGLIAISITHLCLSLLFAPFNFYIAMRVLSIKSGELFGVLKTSIKGAALVNVFSLLISKVLSGYFDIASLVLTVTVLCSMFLYIISVYFVDKEVFSEVRGLIKEAF